MLGLKNAAAGGDLRVIHLLFWAGLWERVDVETMVWVIHNAGPDAERKREIFMKMLILWTEKHELTHHEKSIMQRALAEVKENATPEHNAESIDFFQASSELLKFYS